MLFKQLNIPEYDLTIKATGNQWYWSYEYPDQEISFDSFMLTKEELSSAIRAYRMLKNDEDIEQLLDMYEKVSKVPYQGVP